MHLRRAAKAANHAPKDPLPIVCYPFPHSHFQGCQLIQNQAKGPKFVSKTCQGTNDTVRKPRLSPSAPRWAAFLLNALSLWNVTCKVGV